MKILVCIKQVPATNKVKIDPETGTIIRSGVSSKMNPFDLFALEMALQLKERVGGIVDAICMGPDSAVEVLEEAIAIGADNGCIICDRAFAGSDVLATSYAISQGISAFGDYDLVLCGQQTTDGDTAQVGAEIAEFLGIDHACNVLEVSNFNKDLFEIKVDLGNSILTQTIKTPCLMTVQRDSNTPRLPSYKRKCKYSEKEFSKITLQDMDDTNSLHYGLDGSPTSVEKIFPPDSNTENITLEGSATEKSNQIVNKIIDMKLV